MPYVNVRVTPGISTEQCRQIVAEITEALVRILDKRPEETHIVIDEIRRDRWGFKGELTSAIRQND